MESIGTRLMAIFKEKSDLELMELQIKFAQFNYELKEMYERKIKIIENDIDAQIAHYKNSENHIKIKNEILNRYTKEFQKIYDERKTQFLNIEYSIAEIESNKKIAIVNFYKIADDRKKAKIDTKSGKSQMLALLQKYNGYTALTEECVKKLDECLSSAKDDFEAIAELKNQSLTVAKQSKLYSRIINKILSIFKREKRFEQEVAQPMNKQLDEIEQTNNIAVSKISSQTETILSLIEQVRNEINLQSKLVNG